MSTDSRTDEEDIVPVYNGILLNHKKEWNNAICKDMEIIILSEVRQRQISYNIAYMWNLKKNYYTNDLIYKTEINQQM